MPNMFLHISFDLLNNGTDQMKVALCFEQFLTNCETRTVKIKNVAPVGILRL